MKLYYNMIMELWYWISKYSGVGAIKYRQTFNKQKETTIQSIEMQVILFLKFHNHNPKFSTILKARIST